MAGNIVYDCMSCSTTVEKPRRQDREQLYCSVKCRNQANQKLFSIEKPLVTVYSGRTKLINNKIIVNSEWFDYLNQFSWYISDTGYAIRTHHRQHYRMHHEVIGKPINGLVVDHINRNKLDNQVSNLRIVTVKENAQNGSGRWGKRVYFDLPAGVTYDKSRSKYMVYKPKRKRFDTLQEAIEYKEIN